MYFSKTPNCLTRPAAAGKFQGARGGGVFGVTLRDRERWWGERGHLSFPSLLSDSHSRRRAQLGRALGSAKQPPAIQRRKLRLREVAGGRERADPRSLGLSSVPTALSMLGGKGPQVPKVNQSSCPGHAGERKKPGGFAHKLRTWGFGSQEDGQGHRPRWPPLQPGTSEGQHAWGDGGFGQWHLRGVLHQSLPGSRQESPLRQEGNHHM